MTIEKKHFIYVSLVAFIFYCGVNFMYFPIEIVFGDEGRFIRETVKLYETGEFWKADDRAWEMPLTAIIYSVFYSIFQTQEGLIISVRIFQSLLLILQGFLLYKISIKIFNNQLTAFLTFIIVLFYPFFVYYQGLLLSETFFNTILVISFYYLYTWYENGFKFDINFVLTNFFLAFSIYSKGTLSILPPLLIVGFYFFNKFDFKYSLKIFFYSFILYILFLSPWWIRNYSIFNSFIPFTTSSGMNFYLGNNPYNKDGGCDWSKDVSLDIVNPIFKIKDELERNAVFKQKAIIFIQENPQRFLELAWLKFKRFYNIVPNADTFNQGYYKYISIFSYGLILLLAIISIFIHTKFWQKLSAIYILVIYFTLIHVIFIASLRYRLPIETFFILLASPILSKMIFKLRET